MKHEKKRKSRYDFIKNLKELIKSEKFARTDKFFSVEITTPIEFKRLPPFLNLCTI